MSRFIYFSYGSNMLLERLKARCPSAQKHSVASVENFKVAFIKRSVDLSGKATLVREEGAVVHGVLFTLLESDRACLDAAESKGTGYYAVTDFLVSSSRNSPLVGAETYIAIEGVCDPRLAPYRWYLDVVVAGAIQNKLPEDYVARLRNGAAIDDPVSERAERLMALDALRSAGFETTGN